MHHYPGLRQTIRPLVGPAVILGFLTAGIWACGGEPPPDIAAMGVDSAFVQVVIPILEDQCDDCHFAGGPMYKKMPFDNLEVVAEQGDLMLFQLDGSGREGVRSWLGRLRQERARGDAAGTTGTTGQP